MAVGRGFRLFLRGRRGAGVGAARCMKRGGCRRELPEGAEARIGDYVAEAGVCVSAVDFAQVQLSLHDVEVLCGVDTFGDGCEQIGRQVDSETYPLTMPMHKHPRAAIRIILRVRSAPKAPPANPTTDSNAPSLRAMHIQPIPLMK